MNTPSIYKSTATSYSADDRIGSLPDAISCKVTEERNGEFYCEMTYPAEGQDADKLKVGNIIVTKSRMFGADQPFRISTIEKHLDGTMDVAAYHVCYDLSNVVVMPFTANNLGDALQGLMDNGVPANDFYISANPISWNPSKTFTVSAPTPLTNLLVGSEGSIVDVYGGELEYSGWDVNLYQSRGVQKNVQIAYGKNLSEFTETDELGAYDAVVPYAVVNEVTYYLTDTAVCATAPVVKTSADFEFPRTIALDLSENFPDSAPTQAQLLAAAQSYINGHSTASTANYATSYVDLSKLLGRTEIVNLCDTILLSVTPYNVQNIRLKVIKTVYDTLLDEYEAVIVGDKKVTLADELAKII